jgi:hypothetical protein
MRRWQLLGLVAAVALVVSGCFGGTGSYPVVPQTQNGMIGSGLWHSAGGPSCTFGTDTRPFSNVVFPRVVEPPRAGPRYVNLNAPADIAFHTQDCQTWVQADGPFDAHYGVSIYGVFAGDGDYRVGVEVPAGKYRATTPATCSWQRVSSFGHRLPDDTALFGSNIIASGTGGTVDIAATDVGFVTSNCGAWVGTR